LLSDPGALEPIQSIKRNVRAQGAFLQITKGRTHLWCGL
jgi:hypothetical protein